MTFRSLARPFTLGAAVAAAAFAIAGSHAAAQPPSPGGRFVAPADRGIASEVAHAAGTRDLGRLRGTERITIGLLMRVRSQDQLQQLTLLQGDRHSPLFHHYLTPAQWNGFFAPTPQTYASTISLLEHRGFTITQTYPNRAFIRATGTAGAVERYFSTRLEAVDQGRYGRRYMNLTAGVMPAELRAAVVSVAGLHSIVTMRHDIRFADRTIVRNSEQYRRALLEIGRAAAARRADGLRRFPVTIKPPKPQNVPTPLQTSTPKPNPSPDPGITPGTPATEFVASIGGYGPDIYVNAYDYPVEHGYGGRKHAAGSVIEADYLNSDAALEFTNFGIPRTGKAYRVCPDPNGGPTCYGTIGSADPEGESTLDALTIMSMAPAADFYEYLAPQFDDVSIEGAYERVVSDDIVDAVNSSFGGCETDDPTFGYATNYIAMEGAALGISFEASTGDTGATECGIYVTNGAPADEYNTSVPSSGPYFTAVGGTDFYTLARCSGVGSDCYTLETGWTFGGGGYSTFVPVPSWQAPSLAGQPITSVGSQTMRNTPDVVFTADELPPGDGIAIYYNGADGAIGGTSVASPMWTALHVEINQVQNSRNGFVNPGIYAVQQNATLYKYAFRDLTGGVNLRYLAIPGYDDSTGIGSPLGWELASVENGDPGATAAPATPPPTAAPASPTPTPSPSPSASPVIKPSPAGTDFAVKTIAGSSACSVSMDGTGVKACFANPTGIIYVAAATALNTKAQADPTLFVNDFTSGYLRGLDVSTLAVTTEDSHTWNNGERAVKQFNASNLYGLAYESGSAAEGTFWGGLYVVSGGDDQTYLVNLPTTPNAATTPEPVWKNLSNGTSAATWDAAGEDLGIVNSKGSELMNATFAAAEGLDLTASDALPAMGNFGITNDGAAVAPTYAITDSGLDEILTATDVPGSPEAGVNTSTLGTLASGKPLNAPKEIVYLSSTSAFYVANCGGNDIVRVSSSGAMTVVAGDGAARETDGLNTGAEFDCPFGITTDGTNLFVTDLGGNTVREITKVI